MCGVQSPSTPAQAARRSPSPQAGRRRRDGLCLSPPHEMGRWRDAQRRDGGALSRVTSLHAGSEHPFTIHAVREVELPDTSAIHSDARTFKALHQPCLNPHSSKTKIAALSRSLTWPYGEAMDDDGLLYENDKKEALSRAFATAVAAAAGYCTAPPADFDRDSIDMTFTAGGPRRPKLDAQLKASSGLTEADDHFVFPLPKKNYEDLRADTVTPRILVVLDMPEPANDWLVVTTENLVLRRCAYWKSLAGYPDSSNSTSVTVRIPKANRFDPSSLAALMEQARNGAVT